LKSVKSLQRMTTLSTPCSAVQHQCMCAAAVTRSKQARNEAGRHACSTSASSRSAFMTHAGCRGAFVTAVAREHAHQKHLWVVPACVDCAALEGTHRLRAHHATLFSTRSICATAALVNTFHAAMECAAQCARCRNLHRRGRDYEHTLQHFPAPAYVCGCCC
jgi:hypothetical protein